MRSCVNERTFNLFRRVETHPNFLGQFLQTIGVAKQVKYSSSESGGGGLRASHDQGPGCGHQLILSDTTIPYKMAEEVLSVKVCSLNALFGLCTGYRLVLEVFLFQRSRKQEPSNQ